MKRDRIRLIQEIVVWVCLIGGAVGGIYISGWVMFIKPIIEACRHFDAGTLTGVMVGVTILKCIFASTVGSLVIYIGAALAKAISSYDI